jgi:hypothetical protein
MTFFGSPLLFVPIARKSLVACGALAVKVTFFLLTPLVFSHTFFSFLGGMYFCEACSSSIHSIPAFRSHRLIPSTQKPPSFDLCSKHNKEKEMFCKTCQEPSCMLCVLSAHKEHQYESVIDVAEEYRKNLSSNVEQITRYAETFEASRRVLEEERKMQLMKKAELELQLQKLLEEIKANELAENEILERMEHAGASLFLLQTIVSKVPIAELLDFETMKKMEKRVQTYVHSLFKPEEMEAYDRQQLNKFEKEEPSKSEESSVGESSQVSLTPERGAADASGLRIIANVVALKSSSQHGSCHRHHTLTSDINQFWLSEKGQVYNQYLVYDFGKTRTVKRLQMRFAAFDCCPKDFFIEASADAKGRRITFQARPGKETTDWQTFEGFSISTRYIRIFFINTWDKASGEHVLVSCVRFWE